MHRIPWAACAVALLSPRVVVATTLTLDDALERARRASPAILAARLRPDEARGRLAGASTLLHDNPVIDAVAGPRIFDRGTTTDIDTSITQPLELGGRRSSRISGAQAEVRRETASADDTEREVLSAVASSFLRAVASAERARVLHANEGIASDLLRVAEHRHRAGDIADLELNVSRVAAARAHADVGAAEAARDRAVSELRVLLGMESTEPLELRGDLRAQRPRQFDELLRAAVERPDLRALAADTQAAEAEARLGEGFTWPDLGVRAAYKREQGDDIALGGIQVSVPIFARGQEQRIGGATRARRLRLELETRRRAIEVEVRAAFDAYLRLVDGAEDLERRALPLLDDNDSLARRSYEAGELSLPDYLSVRRETLGARLDYVDRSLEAALAAVELESRAGVLR